MSTKVASLYAEIGAKTDGFERGSKKVKGELKSIAPALENVSKGVTGFISSNAALIGMLTGVGLAINKTVKDHIEYANAVRQQALVSNTSTEAASRYLQVLDDYKISSEEALAATRALTNAGHVPSIDTLAQLSDQYLALNSEQERNEFILKNLGRGGLQWVEVLQKGSKALREQGDSVADNLILTQKMVDDARKAEIAVDNWNDTLQGLKTTFAVGVLPVITDFIEGINGSVKAIGYWDDILRGDITIMGARQSILDEMSYSMLDNAEAAETLSGSTENLSETQESAEDAARKLSDVYQGLLSSMFDIQSQNDSYTETLADLAEESDNLAAEKNKLIIKMNEEREAGKLTNDEYMRYVENLAEIAKSQEENAQAVVDATAEQEKASQQRVYDLTQQKLAADGVVTSGEYEYLQNLAVSYGLVSKAAADQAIAENKRADELVSSFEQTLPPMERTLSLMQEIAGYNGTVVDFGVNFSTNGNPYLPSGGGSSSGSSHGGGASSAGRLRDMGGAGIAGEPYLIGTGAQPELFVPQTSGQFIPKDKYGNTYAITVNNPKRETAENSIRVALKKLSYLGMAA